MDIFHAGLYGYLILTILLLVSFTVSFLFYRKNETGDFKKAVLVLLRTASLFLILSLFLNPFVTSTSIPDKQPADVILADNSLSMGLENRYEQLAPALTETRKLSSNSRVYAFGSGLLDEIKNTGNLYTGSEFRTYSTDLAAALDELYSARGEIEVNSITILSDGIITPGGNPVAAAKKFGVPVYYSLIGDTVQKNDVLIKKIFYNRVAFAGSSTAVKVIINSFGYQRNLNVGLFEEGILKQSKIILANRTDTEYSVEFQVTSGITGVRKYSIKVDTLENEITKFNNERDFFIKYTGNKFKVLVIAGSPGADYSAFRQALSGFENISPDYLTGKSTDSFYEGTVPPLKGYDALFLFGFPLEGTDKSIAQKIAEDAAGNNLPVVFFNSSNCGYESLKIFGNMLPFSADNKPGGTYSSPSRMLSMYAPEEPEPVRKISSLPPAVFLKGAFIPRPGASVLGVTTTDNEPAVLLYDDGKTKSAAFLGFGIYKWTLNSSRENENLIRNLTAVLFNLVIEGRGRNKFYLNTEKDCYAFSEPVEITAYDGTVSPGNTSVRLKITGFNFSREPEMDRNGAAAFRYVFTPDSISDFTAAGMLFSEKQLVAEDVIRFSCVKAADEYVVTKPDESVLKSIAANTGGADIKTYKGASFPKNESVKTGVKTENKSLFRDSIRMLILIIVLLSAEWFLRKRFNLP